MYALTLSDLTANSMAALVSDGPNCEGIGNQLDNFGHEPIYWIIRPNIYILKRKMEPNLAMGNKICNIPYCEGFTWFKSEGV